MALIKPKDFFATYRLDDGPAPCPRDTQITAKREALAAAIEATKQAHDNYMLLAAQEIRLRRELEDLLS